MARGRMLASTLGGSRKFSRLTTNDARLVYCLLLPHTDAYGRVEADPDYVKGTALSRVPITVGEVQAALEDMHLAGLIELYEVDGFQYAEFTDFADHNRTYPSREAQTTIPAPDGNTPERPARDDTDTPDAEPSQDSVKTKARPRPENVSTKRKRKENTEEDLKNPPTPLADEPTPDPQQVKATPLPPEVEKPDPPKPKKPPKKLTQHEFNPATTAHELPEQFDPDLFQDFCRMRHKIGAPMTLEALKQFIGKHKKHPKPVLDEMFRNAIVANWKDLYPLKNQPGDRPPAPPGTALDQYTERGL